MEEQVIEEKIAADAYKKWPYGDEPRDVEDAKKITGNSEIAAVEGIVKTLGLDESIITQLIGTKNESGEYEKNGEIYTRSSISSEIVSEIQESMQDADKNKVVLDILSNIHDAWVIKNSDNFLKPGRNRERQFVPLQLLNWEEVESDLVFLKPILGELGIQIHEEELKQEHNTQRLEYLKENGLFSKKDIIRHIGQGSKKYPALEGLTTKSKDGKSIDELLRDSDISGEMSSQIIGKLIKDVLSSEDSKYRQIYWVQTSTQINLDTPGAKENGLQQYDQPMTYAEIMVRELLGANIRKGFVGRDYDRYENKVRTPIGDEWHAADLRESKIKSEYKEYKISIGGTEIDSKLFFEAGINPEELGLGPKEIGTVSPKSIAKAGEHYKTSKGEINGIRGVLAKIFNRNKENEKGE